MSIATRIESIEEHIEQAYDELQGLGADLTNVNKNIENISMVLDDIYDSMPQVSGEGTSLTLDDTRVGKIKSTLKGNTSQTGIPTPTSPIPISVVSGDNTITISNQDGTDSNTYNIDLPVENLFNSNLKQGGRYFNNGNFFTADNYVHNENPISVVPGETYTLSATNYSARSEAGFVFFNNGTYVSGSKQSSQTFTVPSNANQVYCDFYTGSNVTPSDITNIQLEKGSKTNSFTPYGTTPIELCKIGNYQDYFGKSTGKNLWHFTSEALYSVNSVSPTIINENTLKLVSTSNTYANALYLLDLPNGSYTFSLGRVNNSNSSMTTKRMSLVEIVNGTITVIQHIDEGTTYTATIANESGKKYGLRFWATWNTALVNTATFNEIQIEKGTQATTYEPYGKVWYLTKQTSKITFNGSENWGRSGNTSESFFCGVLAGTGIPFKAKMETAIDSKCDYFTKGNSRSNAEVFDMYNGTDYYTAFALYLSTNKVTDITAFKNWLASNNITLYYVLYQPTTEVVEYQPLIDQLNELEKAMSKDGQTNISQVNNDLPFIISASALKEWSV